VVRHKFVMHPLCAAYPQAVTCPAPYGFALVTLCPLLEIAMDPNPKFPNPAFINDLVNKLDEVLKQSPAKDIEQNLKAGVTSVLGKLDMVSREEFDVQSEVLARTREKLAQLEARLTELEKQQREEEE
jgi:BMFP domain-containing protein YqiC